MMLIQTEDGKEISASQITGWRLRTSLEPIPATLEAELLITESFASMILEGKVIKVGKYLIPMQIIYASDSQISEVENSKGEKVRSIVAIHKGTLEASYRAEAGIFRDNSSLVSLYRACGCKGRFGRDIKTPKAYVFKGKYITEQVAQILQENAAMICLDVASDTVNFESIQQAFERKVKAKIGILGSSFERSEFIERTEAPMYLSVDDKGIIKSYGNNPRNTVFIPESGSGLTLSNMRKVLINAGCAQISYNADLNAGDMVENERGTKFIVITAGHFYSDNGGSPSYITKLWIGVLDNGK